MSIIRIRNWEVEYENSDTKKVKHFTRYLPLPNDLSSFEYARIVSHQNGEALVGAWLALRCVASKGTPRGYLVETSGEPHTVESLALVTRFSMATIQKALELFTIWKMLEVCRPDGTVIPPETEPQISESLRTNSETAEDLRESPNPSENFRLEEIEERRRDEKREEEIRREENPPLPPRGEFAEKVLEVFEHYRGFHPRAFKRPQTKSKEWQVIESRLREGYTVEDLRAAIDGMHRTPFNLGENERGTKYLGLCVALKSGDQVTRFAEAADSIGGPVLSSRTQKTGRAASAYLSRKGGPADVVVAE